MNLNQLKIFYISGKLRSFSGAAEELLLTQPSDSHQFGAKGRVRLVSHFSQKMGETKGEVLLSNGPLRSFQMFQLKFREALKGTEKFSLLIGRMDDYADRLKLWGENSLLEIQKEMNLNLEEKLPP